MGSVRESILCIAILGICSVGSGLPVDIRLDSIAPTPDGKKTVLTFTENGETKITLVDDDGVATLAVLQYMLIQGPAEEAYKAQRPEDIEKIKRKELTLPQRDLLYQALGKVAKYYKEAATDHPSLSKAAEEIGKLHQAMISARRITPTISELEDVSEWLNKHAQKHRYQMYKNRDVTMVGLLDNNTALGRALTSFCRETRQKLS